MRKITNKADWMFKTGKQPAISWFLKQVGYPVPPQLDRGWDDGKPRLTRKGSILTGRQIGVMTAAGDLSPLVSENLTTCGATLAEPSAGFPSLDGVVIDATKLTVSNTGLLWKAAKVATSSVKRAGRIAVISNAANGIVSEACTGFVKSLAKEVGGLGINVNNLAVPGAGPSLMDSSLNVLTGPLSYLLSSDAAFVTAQTLAPAPRLHVLSTAQHTLAGKVAVVTGGARGIGEAIVLRLASEGARVVIVDVPKTAETLSDFAKEIDGTAFTGDVTDPSFPAALKSFLMDKFGGVDVIVHNAGITQDKTLRKMSESQVEAVLNVNLRAIININEEFGVSRNADKAGGLRDGGSVVMMSSINGIAGAFGQTNYAFTKAALMRYTAELSALQGLTNRGVAVAAVAPGFIETKMTAAVPALGREIGRRLNCFSQGGLPFDIAAAVAFLASPGGSGMSGQTLRVCGGHITGR